MIRKVINDGEERIFLYIIKDYLNVSAIISELSILGCNGEELGTAYRKLTSNDKNYTYKDKVRKDTLIVVDNT